METKKKSKGQEPDTWQAYFSTVPTLNDQGAGSLTKITSADVAGAPSTAVREALYKLVTAAETKQGCVTFYVVYLPGFGKKDDPAKLLKHESYTKYASASACAESAMYEAIKGTIKSGYLVVAQDCAPCRNCIGSYSGLAVAKSMTILVYYDETHDLLNKAPGAVIFTPEGGVFWFRHK